MNILFQKNIELNAHQQIIADYTLVDFDEISTESQAEIRLIVFYSEFELSNKRSFDFSNYRELLKIINSIELDTNKNIFPSGSNIPNLFELKFFKEAFPSLNIEQLSYEKSLTNFMRPVDIEFINEQVIISNKMKNENQGMHPGIQEYLNILNS